MTTAAQATEQTPAERLTAAMASYGITITSEFVPFSKSRNAKPREDGKVWRSLNWKVTVTRQISNATGAARVVLTTDYSAGEGHCPASKASVARLGNSNSIMRDEAIAWECEHGFPSSTTAGGYIVQNGKTTLQPEPADVMAALLMDSDVIDCSSFEEWASNVGYDTDSRKAEATYRACLETALKLRNGLGEEALRELREAAADY